MRCSRAFSRSTCPHVALGCDECLSTYRYGATAVEILMAEIFTPLGYSNIVTMVNTGREVRRNDRSAGVTAVYPEALTRRSRTSAASARTLPSPRPPLLLLAEAVARKLACLPGYPHALCARVPGRHAKIGRCVSRLQGLIHSNSRPNLEPENQRTNVLTPILQTWFALHLAPLTEASFPAPEGGMKAGTGTRRPNRRPRAAKHVAERDVREVPNDMIVAAVCS